jgi:hypothetical protein
MRDGLNAVVVLHQDYPEPDDFFVVSVGLFDDA